MGAQRKLLEHLAACLYAPKVDPKVVLSELLYACRGLGLTIRDEPMKVPATRLAGGLVRLRGTAMVIVDSAAPVVDRVAAVADALCELAVDPLHLSPDARRAITLARSRRRRMRRNLRMQRGGSAAAWKSTMLLRPKPGVLRSIPPRDPE